MQADDVVAALAQDWLRQHGYAAGIEGEAVVPVAWLVSELDRHAAEYAAFRAELLDPDNMWSVAYAKGYAAALRHVRASLPSGVTDG